MAYMRTEVYSTDRNILASEVGLVQKTKQALKSMATKNEEDKYIRAQGTIFPSNDSKAEGIVFESVDMTYFDKKPISVIVAGRIIEKNLPVTVSAEAKTALKASGIYFE